MLASTHSRAILDSDFDINRIVSALSLEAGVRIVPGKTLVVIDEVQEAPRALTSLKYFCQDAPEHHVAAAGSYLGLAKHEGVSFPVGKENKPHIHPLSFLEFLDAIGEDVKADALRGGGACAVDSALSPIMRGLFKECLFVGAMHEAVDSYAAERDFADVRRIQDEILVAYDHDFSKHAPTRTLARMRLVWNGLPAQLAEENKKYLYGAVRPGARACDFEESIQWLVDYGAAVRVPRASALRGPLSSYRDENAFKLFCVDVGLLGALPHLPVEAVIDESFLFTEFKGACTEQYVCQQLICQGLEPSYWSSDSGRAEVGFAIEFASEPLPIEVKASENLQAKSLKVSRDKFSLPCCVRASLSDYRDDGWLVNVSLWAIMTLPETLVEAGYRGGAGM